jgi:hypothetical protein
MSPMWRPASTTIRAARKMRASRWHSSWAGWAKNPSSRIIRSAYRPQPSTK